jgi:hypothetical protein
MSVGVAVGLLRLIDVPHHLEVGNLFADGVLDAHAEGHEAGGAGAAGAVQLEVDDLVLVRDELAVASVALEVGTDLLEDRLDALDVVRRRTGLGVGGGGVADMAAPGR